MSVRLRLLSLWMPRFIMVRELDSIGARTNAVLDSILSNHSSSIKQEVMVKRGSMDERRKSMAEGHELRVRALIDALGREEAIRVAREALFAAGLEMGREARARLEVSGSKGDLVRAAGIMYRVLGIEFTVIDDPGVRRLVVNRCALAHDYSHEACLMLSAVDEGVVSGLDPTAMMRFTEHMTSGSPRCVAVITMREGK